MSFSWWNVTLVNKILYSQFNRAYFYCISFFNPTLSPSPVYTCLPSPFSLRTLIVRNLVVWHTDLKFYNNVFFKVVMWPIIKHVAITSLVFSYTIVQLLCIKKFDWFSSHCKIDVRVLKEWVHAKYPNNVICQVYVNISTTSSVIVHNPLGFPQANHYFHTNDLSIQT